jgi:N-terminal domain of toast_rack, DUF2154
MVIMSKSLILLFIAAVLLTTLACGISIDLPVERIVTGPTQTEEILIPAAEAEVVDLSLNFGAGELNIQHAGNASEAPLVKGTAVYNVPDFKPQIKVEPDNVSLTTGQLELRGIPSLNNDVENRWDLELGNTPMNLEINSGAYKGDLDLSGLALESLDITDGAADVRLRFSTPNPLEMDRLRYQTGASNVQLFGLANANFSSMVFHSGAGNYRLDFSGLLNRDAVVNIESGFSQVELVVPEGTTAKVFTGGGLMNVDYSGGWKKEGNLYLLGSGGPVLTINVDMGAGSLALQTK